MFYYSYLLANCSWWKNFMPEPLKNMYNTQFIQNLSTALHSVDSSFPVDNFTQQVINHEWEKRELKDRMRHITHCLRVALPADYRAALNILRQAAAHPLLAHYTFQMMICPDFVEVYGLQDWDASLPALEQFTQQCSAEFAVRPFIVQDTERMMAQMLQWASHENHHLRRLASEGCRPRLPWAMALPAFKSDPSPILPILETLKQDESEYVRRSVANNLNDIAKDNPQVVLATLQQWNQTQSKNMQWLVNHGLRTLTKAGNSEALALLGYGEMLVEVQNLSIQPTAIRMGADITFSFEVTSKSAETQSLMIDYVVYFARANGKASAKVFKLRKLELAPEQSLAIAKKHSFRPITTRRYYAGQHAIAIQVNGTILARQEFMLNE
jgi:3-methyladenine DNA glycosylase AlkC